MTTELKVTLAWAGAVACGAAAIWLNFGTPKGLAALSGGFVVYAFAMLVSDACAEPEPREYVPDDEWRG